DSGIDYNHPDLDANYAGGWDFVNNDDDPVDIDGHGTHVAGTIAAEDNGFGVVGVAPEASIYALKTLEGGEGYYSDVIDALQWAVDNEIQVTNNSYGSSGDPGEIVKAAFDTAYYTHGVLHVAAAGNTGNPPGRDDNIIYPARWDSVMAVAATDTSDDRARWSSTGPDAELSAPGVNINSTLVGGGYGGKSGTSMASPHVAGTAALVLVAYPNWTNADVRTQLQNTADDLGDAEWDTKYGYGLVDADEAAAAAGNLSPVADAGSDQTVTDSDGDGVEAVTLEASTSYDPDGTITAYEWTESGVVLSTEVSFTYYFAVGTHTVTLTITDNEGATGTDTVIVTVTEVATYPTVTVSIEITTETKQAGRNIFTTALATVTIVDANGAPVEGVTVYGQWSGLTSDADSGVTDLNGVVILKSEQVKNASGSFAFTVDSVTKGEVTYELSGETSDSIVVP
ncbi:MAG: S8 family serine peptidase, partial [Dehalococcoidales bacterium]